MTMEGSEREPRVSYALKDILNRMDGKLESIDAKLDGKVDRHELVAIVDRVNSQGERITSLDKRQELHAALLSDREKRSEATFSRREKIIGMVIGAMVVLVTAVHPAWFGGHP